MGGIAREHAQGERRSEIERIGPSLYKAILEEEEEAREREKKKEEVPAAGYGGHRASLTSGAVAYSALAQPNTIGDLQSLPSTQGGDDGRGDGLMLQSVGFDRPVRVMSRAEGWGAPQSGSAPREGGSAARFAQWKLKRSYARSMSDAKKLQAAVNRAEDVRTVRWLRSNTEPCGQLPMSLRDDVSLPSFIDRVAEWGGELKHFGRLQRENNNRERARIAVAEGLPSTGSSSSSLPSGIGARGDQGGGTAALPVHKAAVWRELHDAQLALDAAAMRSFVMSDAWKRGRSGQGGEAYPLTPHEEKGVDVEGQLAAMLHMHAKRRSDGRMGGEAVDGGPLPPPLPSQARPEGHALLASWLHVAGQTAPQTKVVVRPPLTPFNNEAGGSALTVRSVVGGLQAPHVPVAITIPNAILPPSVGDSAITPHYGLYDKPVSQYAVRQDAFAAIHAGAHANGSGGAPRVPRPPTASGRSMAVVSTASTSQGGSFGKARTFNLSSRSSGAVVAGQVRLAPSGFTATGAYSTLAKRQSKKQFHYDFKEEQLAGIISKIEVEGLDGDSGEGHSPSAEYGDKPPRNGIIALTFPFPKF